MQDDRRIPATDKSVGANEKENEAMIMMEEPHASSKVSIGRKADAGKENQCPQGALEERLFQSFKERSSMADPGNDRNRLPLTNVDATV
jgi:hypothetical protein